MAMKYNNMKGRLGKRRRRRSFVVRKVTSPYVKELHVSGVK